MAPRAWARAPRRHGGAVSPEPVAISPSQVGAWEQCPRRWWYARHRVTPPHPAAAAGTRTHHVLEGWLEHGTAPDTGPDAPEPTDEHLAARTAVAGLALIPEPRKAAVEIPFEFTIGGVTYRGRVDYLVDYVHGAAITIADHKTIGDLRRRKTPEDLATDPQWIIYAFWAAETYDVERVEGRWIYYQRVTRSKSRRTGKAARVEVSVTRAEARRRFWALHTERAAPLVEAKRLGLGPDRLARNFAACGLYPPGGCPYRLECHADVDPLERAAALL